MIINISENIKVHGNQNRIAIQEINEFEDSKTTIKIYTKQEAIELANALLKLANEI